MIREPEVGAEEREPDPPHYTFSEKVVLGCLVLWVLTCLGLVFYGFFLWS